MYEFSNKELSKILDELAKLLEIKGENKYKIRAYQNISRKITNINQDISQLVKEDKLQDIKGVGKGIAGEINEIFEKGFSPALEEIKNELPAGVIEMVEIPGLGPKRANKLFNELEISDISDLKKALKNGEVREIRGFGKKIEEKLLKALNEYKEYKDLILLDEAERKAEEIINQINKNKNEKIINELKLAGSLRRKTELIGDIDILVLTNFPDKAGELITNLDFSDVIIDKGSKKLSIYTKEKIRVDFRFVSPENKFPALQYFTGSKEHNVKIRQIAKDNNYKLNEYGLFKIKDNGEFNRINIESEKELYNQLGLDLIIPELREDLGEIEAALKSELPDVINYNEIKGDLHIHSKYSDGAFSMADMTEKALELGYEYIAFSDHSKSLKVANGLSKKDIKEQREEINILNKKYSDIKILQGIEVDILRDGSLDYEDEILNKFREVRNKIEAKVKNFIDTKDN